MFFGSEHVTEANSHHCSAAQFCLCEISASGSIDSLHEFAVQIIEFLFVGANKTKTNHAHADRSGELEAVVFFDPVGEQVCKANLFAQARHDPLARSEERRVGKECRSRWWSE